MDHALAERRSLELHREVARRLRENPRLVDAARARAQGWLEDGIVHPRYVQAWLELLSKPLEELCARLTADDEGAKALRQTTPFSGVVDPKTRWRIWREVREQGPG